MRGVRVAVRFIRESTVVQFHSPRPYTRRKEQIMPRLNVVEAYEIVCELDAHPRVPQKLLHAVRRLVHDYAEQETTINQLTDAYHDVSSVKLRYERVLLGIYCNSQNLVSNQPVYNDIEKIRKAAERVVRENASGSGWQNY